MDSSSARNVLLHLVSVQLTCNSIRKNSCQLRSGITPRSWYHLYKIMSKPAVPKRSPVSPSGMHMIWTPVSNSSVLFAFSIPCVVPPSYSCPLPLCYRPRLPVEPAIVILPNSQSRRITTTVIIMAIPSQKPQHTYVRRERFACCRASHESLCIRPVSVAIILDRCAVIAVTHTSSCGGGRLALRRGGLQQRSVSRKQGLGRRPLQR